ncbi:MAG: helix-turn-helix domain-containing protein [Saccharothrix sp.]|nr:helix-turn-helix domain-containing protein [Saccharothrix sp.]
MARVGTPVSQHRRLRAELRQARERAGLTQQGVADALEWSVSKLIRIENGSVGVSITDLKALLLHYGVTDADEVAELVELARGSKQSAWWHAYKNQVSQQFLTFLGLEASAIRVRQFQGILVPGLLQAKGYASVLAAAGGENEEAVNRNLQIRLKRQEMITEDGPEAFFILDESILHRQIGSPEVMREQLLKLKALTEHPKLTIQVLPFSAGVHKGMVGSFEIFELSDQPDDYALVLEGPYKDVLHANPSEETKEYVRIFFELEKIARPAEETASLIDRRLHQMENED